MTGVKVFIGFQIAALFAMAGVVTWSLHLADEQRERDCLQSIESRDFRTETEVATWEDVQDIFDVDPEYEAAFDDLVDRIRARAEALPPPASCEG